MSDEKEEIIDEQDGHDAVDPSIGLTPLENMLRKADIAEFMLQMLKKLKVDCGFRSIKMANAPYDYYSWDLEKRAKFLGAPSYQCLTKTMIMVNYFYREENASDPHYPRFVVVIVQYCRQISSQKVLNVMKRYQNSFYENQPEKKVGIKGFKFRLSENTDMEKLSGYRFNAVTPFFMADQTLPVILDDSIASLDCGYFWLGGGRVSLKLGTSVDEFKQHLGKRLIVDKISDSKK